MAGVVYLKTNLFEVKLEGITFNANDFGRLCTEDFLFPNGNVWVQAPIVGIDIMRHPRDPSILLVLLCFGTGCVIQRFHTGAALPESIRRFFCDRRVRFVGFGLPEKSDLFPFEELGMMKETCDIGYLAAEHFNNPKYIKSDLGVLANKILGVKRMFGLTQVSYFERHEQIKCAVCQLFITTVVAMSLFGKGDEFSSSPKKRSFLKNLSLLSSITEGLFRVSRGRKEEKIDSPKAYTDVWFQTTENSLRFRDDSCLRSKSRKSYSSRDRTRDSFHCRSAETYACSDSGSGSRDRYDDYVGKGKENKADDNDCRNKAINRRPLKGILRCQTSPPNMEANNPKACSAPSTPRPQSNGEGPNRRANAKGYNVTFKFH